MNYKKGDLYFAEPDDGTWLITLEDWSEDATGCLIWVQGDGIHYHYRCHVGPYFLRGWVKRG